MTRWLEWLFGARLSGRGEASDWHVDWASAPAGGDGVLLIMVLALFIGWAIWWLYRRDAEDLTPRRRWTLIALRVTAILLVLAMFLEPVLVIEREEDYPSNLVILQDISASMQIKDGVEDAIRARDQAAVLGLASPEEVGNLSRTDLFHLARVEGLEEALRADGDRRVHRHEFADQLFLDRESDPQRLRSAQQYTAVGGALEQVLAAYEGQPLAGILLVTDGQSNAGPAMQRSAEAAAAAQVPIQVLGLGSDQKARNAAIAKVEANEVVFVADPIEVKVWVDARGMSSEVAGVRLERSVDGGSWETLKTAEIVFGDSGQLTELSFEDALDRPAKIDYRASLEGVGREVTTDDNVSGTKTQVVKKKIRALLVAGLAFPEVQFLINTLMRDQSIDVSSWLMFAESDYKQKGNEIITRLPQTAEELDVYDCVILYDTDLKEMPANFGDLLVDFVGQDGGGLVYIAGESATADLFDRKRAGAEDICNLLPVIREPGVFRSRVEMRLSAQTEWKFELTAAGREAGLFRFEEDAEKNARTLEALPGMYWHFPVTREKPGATVLARHGDARMSNAHGRHVVLATQRFGPGRTYFIGLDSSYRWRFLDEKYFDGFWGRLVNRAALAKRLGGRQPFSLRTDQKAYAPGSVVTLRAELRDLDEVSVATQSIVAEIESGDEGSEPLIFSQVDGQIGIFEAQYAVRRSGPHFVRAWAGESPQPGARPVTYEFRVEFPNRELAAPSLDRARLTSLAQATGGRLFALEEVNQIADAFKTRRVARRELERQELWDGLILWGLALLLIFIEWVLRKRYRLV